MNLLRSFLRFQVRISALIFLPTAAVLFIASVVFLLTEVRFVRAARHATGTITAMEERRDTDGDVGYYPHFTFTKPGGTVVEVVSNVGTQPPSFEVGEQVPVLFSQRDPESAKIATTFQIYGMAIIFSVIGAAFVPLGFLARYPRRRFFPV